MKCPWFSQTILPITVAVAPLDGRRGSGKPSIGSIAFSGTRLGRQFLKQLRGALAVKTLGKLQSPFRA